MDMERKSISKIEAINNIARQKRTVSAKQKKSGSVVLQRKNVLIKHSIPDEFTHGQIRVKSLYPLQEISDLTITRKFNEHGMLTVKGILEEEQKDCCVERAGANDPIEVYGQNENGQVLLFSGHVTELCVRHVNRIYYVEIKGMSCTCVMDYEERKRSFQDESMTYSALLKQVTSSYPGGTFLNAASDSITGQFILQYKETDWAFLKRMASHFHTVLIADTMSQKPRFSFGIPKNPKTLNHTEQVTVRRDIVSYQQALSTGLSIGKQDFTKYQFISKHRLGLGDWIRFQGKICIVEQTRAFLKAGVLYYEYVIGHEEGMIWPRQRNDKIHGVSLLGEVLDSSNQTVKLKLKIDEGQDVNKARWFPYAAQANNLLYCMPEKKTSISLYFPNADETSAMAVNAVRRNGGNCAKMSNPNLKYMGTPEGKEFKLGETDIDFTAMEGLFMKMDTGIGVQVKSHEDLNIFSKQKLLLKAKEMFQVVANKGNVSVATGDESFLYLLGGLDGDSHVLASSELLYEGRSREAFAPLNKAIAYEEKPEFSWLKLAGCVLAGLAVVAAVVLVVATAGAAAVALGAVSVAVVNGAVAGAAIAGAIAVGSMAVGDILSGKNSSVEDYMKAALEASIEGAITGAIGGGVYNSLSSIKYLKNARFFGKCIINSVEAFVTDAVVQLSDMLLHGKPFDWKQSLTSVFFTLGSTGGARGINKLFGNKLPTGLKKFLCEFAGEPVNVITGAMTFDVIDFELPGPLPLRWERNWHSDSGLTGHLGHGSRCNFEMGLELFEEEGLLAVFLADGRVVSFPWLLVGEENFNYQEKLLLRRETTHYCAFDPESRYSYVFSEIESGYMGYKLTEIRNGQGHKISLEYNHKGYLSQITDSVKRVLTVVTNEVGRITQVALNTGSGHQILVQYAYNEEQDMIKVTDAKGQSTKMEYRNHLMLRKIDRNKNAFHWKYESTETGARVTETWGDGNVLLVRFMYHDEECYNEVTDSQGNTTQHYYNENKLCTKIIYADRTETRTKYNDRFELVNEIDEEGRLTLYAYDDWSNVTRIAHPDGGSVLFQYDEEGRCTATTNPEGDSWSYQYNQDDTLQASIDPVGGSTTYSYNEKQLVETVTNAKGNAIRLLYDEDLNVSQITLPDGASSSWQYDYRGNCLSATNPLGATDSYEYDSLDRLVRANLADGNEVQLTYNAYDEVIRAKDKHSDVSFTYTILGSLTSRMQNGRKVAFEYNKEEQLMGITNEKGEVYQFERDVKGNIMKEIGFDQVTRTYERDLSGLVKKIHRPANRFTIYQHDKGGRVIRAEYYDGTWDTFGYNKNGALVEASNKDTALKFEYNQMGQVIQECQDKHQITNVFDELGNRIEITSSLGAKIAFAYNERGQVSHLAAAQWGQSAWAAKMHYNELGQEIERMLPGDVMSKWQYDPSGRPVHHQVRRNHQDTRRRKYSWDMNYRLKSIRNELTGGQTKFGYDEFHNLVWSQGANFEFLYRSTDEVGNLYETKGKSDRIYAEGSRLQHANVNIKELRNEYQGGHGKLVTKGTEFSYDEEGNLVQKVEPKGDVWRYEYYGNGMMSKVIKPDETEVTFKYDPLGRRVEKRSDIKVVKFVWNGNVPIHEWEEELEQLGQEKILGQQIQLGQPKQTDVLPSENDSLVTWVFHDGFVPSAKITKDGNYSIISDYLGTPVEAYDQDGKKVWSAELDVYGRVREFTGDRDFIPFRYQGQYHDVEIGFYYNRMRYYDPSIGQYTQQDPIGLAGNNPTPYAYVHDTNGWVDEFALDCHHIATNKNKVWSDRFRDLFKKNGLGKFKNGNWRKDVLNDPLNKVRVPGHQGPHSPEMHQEIYNRLLNASNKGPDAFRKELQKLASEAQQVGSWLNNILTKK